MRVISWIIAITLGLYQLSQVSGCTCNPSTFHEQQYFCDADFVIRAVVLRRRYIGNNPPNREIRYTVQIEAIYRGTIHVFPVRRAIIYAYEGSSLCGVILEVGDDMLLTGHRSNDGQYRLSSCNSWITHWDSLTQLEKLGLRYGLYTRACLDGCNIVSDEQDGDQLCDMGFPVCCHVEESPCLGSVCLRTSQGRCDWSRCLRE